MAFFKRKNKILDNPFITELKDENGDSWYHQVVLDIHKERAKEYKNRINKAIEIIDIITPELWNISNKMTYKLKDIKNILKGEK